MFELHQYQALAQQTAIYPENLRIIYPTLGLCGEAGEVASKLLNDNIDKEAIEKELGDLCWYISGVAFDCGIWFTALISQLKSPQKRNLSFWTLALCEEVGKVAELIKKAYRDEKGIISPDRKHKLAIVLQEVTQIVVNIGGEFDLSLEQICESNIKKLKSRMNRGKIGGSGDNR